MSSNDVRAQLINALELDLIGPRTGHPPHAAYAREVLPVAPSKWYLTGFLVPYEAPANQRADDDGDEQLDQPGRRVDADDDSSPEAASARKAWFPSSMGLSVLVAAEATGLDVRVSWGDYQPVQRAPEAEGDDPRPIEERTGRGQWARRPQEVEQTIPLRAGTHAYPRLPGLGELSLVVSVRAVSDYGLLPPGTRSVSIFLVNHRPHAPDLRRDTAYVFQPELSLHSSVPFVARPDLHGLRSEDWDEQVADLQYQDAVEHAVGHNIAAVAERDEAGDCRRVRTAWMPTAEVEKVVPRELPEVELGMEALAAAPSAAALRERVGPMLRTYAAWLAGQPLPEEPRRRAVALTLLGRAATLVCALELTRQEDVPKLGPWPFEIGLWVGQTATPNHMGRKGDNNPYSARARTIAFLNDSGRKPSPVPLENCPWCGWKFTKDSFRLLPNPDEPSDLRVMCVNTRCAFHGRRQPRGIPILAVDDPIYRRLPAFIVATVDKFANLPWVGHTAGLFGKVQRHDKEGFYGPSAPGVGVPLKGPLPPPDLVIQDELHLISGPLGTMVGLYEAAIDALGSASPGGEGPRPKIVASTATVRRADRQIRALFGRTAVEVFPPPGPDRRDSFFARTVAASEKNPRVYVGIAAQGRNLKVVLLRSYLTLMSAAQKAWKENGGDKNLQNPADPYLTLLGYFNSLRELGGSRRIVEDEVATRLVDHGLRRRRVGETVGLFADRPRLTEPRELTSRVSTNDVSDTKRRLALPHQDKEHIDVALATNMISVGLDITRLGLMVVLGQPKTASEYIQATSRVGRDDMRPGLVVTLLNTYRPRDRSHYERFSAWHESFYRSVEATSVTPFSPRAIDRGIAAVTVALARLGHPGMTAPRGAFAVTRNRVELDFVASLLSRRAEGHDAALDREEAEALRKSVKERVSGLLDAWQSIATKKGDLQYQSEIGGAVPPLLFDPLDPAFARLSEEAQQFKANRSLRDVEPTVNLWLRNPDGALMEEDPA